MIRQDSLWGTCQLTLLFLPLLFSCERRPLTETAPSLTVQVVIDVEEIKNVYTGIYNDGLSVASIVPEQMQVFFYEISSHQRVAEGFLVEQSLDAEGRQVLSGKMTLPPGVYDMLCYNFDTSSTLVKNEEDWEEIEAYTDEIPSRHSRKGDCGEGLLYYEPDHLVVAREKGIRMEAGCCQQVICTRAHTVMDTYYIQLGVTGCPNLSYASAVLTGLASSNRFARDERNESQPSAILFEMFKSEDPAFLREGKTVLCAVFNTFGKIPDASSELRLKIVSSHPDVMGYEGVKAAVAVLNGEDLGGKVVDTGVSVLTK